MNKRLMNGRFEYLDSYITLDELNDTIVNIKTKDPSATNFGISCSDYYMDLTYESLENDKEYDARIKFEERRKKEQQERKLRSEQKERKLLEKLKRKYEEK